MSEELDQHELEKLDRVVSIVAESVGDGFLRIKFVQNGKTMANSHNSGPAEVLLHYARQGEMMRNPGEPSATEQKAIDLDLALERANELLLKWCS